MKIISSKIVKPINEAKGLCIELRGTFEEVTGVKALNAIKNETAKMGFSFTGRTSRGIPVWNGLVEDYTAAFWFFTATK